MGGAGGVDGRSGSVRSGGQRSRTGGRVSAQEQQRLREQLRADVLSRHQQEQQQGQQQQQQQQRAGGNEDSDDDEANVLELRLNATQQPLSQPQQQADQDAGFDSDDSFCEDE